MVAMPGKDKRANSLCGDMGCLDENASDMGRVSSKSKNSADKRLLNKEGQDESIIVPSGGG